MSISQDDLSLELRNNLIIGLSIGVIGGGAVGFLMTAATLFLNPGFLASFRDSALLTLVLVGVYMLVALVIGLTGALLKTLYFLFRKRRLSDTKTAAVSMGMFFFLLVAIYGIFWCRWYGVGGASREGLIQVEALPIYLVVLGASLILSRLFTYAMYILIVYWKEPHEARRGDWSKAFFVLGYVALFTIVFMIVIRTTTTPSAGDDRLDPSKLAFAPRPVTLIGMDGMTGDRLLALADEGLIPDSERWTREASWIRLDPGRRLIPPVQWTSLVTGQTYRRHGIADYKVETLRGLRTPLVVRPGQVGLYEAFNHVLPFFRLTESMALRSQMRQSKALWDLAGEVGLVSSVVGWWATWPAESVRGAMVTDHAYLKLKHLLTTKRRGEEGSVPIWDPSVAEELEAETYPEDLLLELAPLLETLSEDQAPHGLPSSLFASAHLYAGAALHLRAKIDPDLSLLYLPGPDVMKRLLSKEKPNSWRGAFEPALRSYFELLRDPLQDFLHPLSQREEETLTILITLPGWKEEEEDGWLVLAGPSIRKGIITEERYELADAAATLIYLLGLPVAQDLGGRPVLEVVDPSFVAENPPETVSTYGFRSASPGHAPPTELDREMLDRLRSLGYIGS
jgi:hypothetical protein